MWGKQILPGKFGNDYFLRKLCPTQEFHITNRGVGDAGIEDAYSRIDGAVNFCVLKNYQIVPRFLMMMFLLLILLFEVEVE